jgi:hypothetical protein
MRELLGMPRRVAGAVFGTMPGIFGVLFQYDGFPAFYETGLSDVPQFDSHVEVYSPDKIVRVDFDTPYIKGLPVTLTIRERVGEDGFQERKVRKDVYRSVHAGAAGVLRLRFEREDPQDKCGRRKRRREIVWHDSPSGCGEW